MVLYDAPDYDSARYDVPDYDSARYYVPDYDPVHYPCHIHHVSYHARHCFRCFGALHYYYLGENPHFDGFDDNLLHYYAPLVAPLVHDALQSTQGSFQTEFRNVVRAFPIPILYILGNRDCV